MSDTVTCPSCQRTLRVPESLLGQLVKCPTCQQTFTASLGGEANGAPEAPPPRKEAPREHYEDEPPRPSRRDDDDYEEGRPRRRRRRYQQDHRGTLILVLGILSVFGFAWPILGIIAWILGSNDLKEMRAGRMDPAGESQTNTGRICGMISTLLGAVLMVGCCSIYLIFFAAAASSGAIH